MSGTLQSTEPQALITTPEQTEVVAKLALKFAELGIEGKILPTVTVGPLVTAYRILPQGKTRVTHIEALAEDFAIAIGTAEKVLVKRMPGESAVGIFVPNKDRHPPSFQEAMSYLFSMKDKKVPLCFGQTQTGNFFVEDLIDLPHLLIAGSTGSGKSTLMHALIAGLIYCKKPDEVQFIISDTKGVEFKHFIGASHLLFPPQTSGLSSLEKIKWAIDEMELRLKKIGEAGVHNIVEYNQKQNDSHFYGLAHDKALSHIVIVIDELADLMGDFQKLTEQYVGKIVQKARAAGVYLLAGTQRPSVDVIKGSIKSNILGRLSFRLPSGTDSRTVLDTTGAEYLLSKGDMLYKSPLRNGLLRLHSPKASINDIKSLIEAAQYAK